MDPRHLELAAQFCEMVGFDDLFDFLGLDEDVRAWFDFPVPKARVGRQRIARALAAPR